MQPSAARHLLLVAAAACIFFLPVITHALNETQPAARPSARRPTCTPQEREALLAFKQGITRDPAGHLRSWQRGGGHGEQDCCRWRGVRCSTRTGHVSELRLRGALDGNSYPLDGKALVGQISSSLLTLEYLEHLDLSSNSLEGPTGHIPEFLGSFKNLKHLDLSYIPFLGMLPPQLGNLSKLQYLNLSACGMGCTSSTDISWLTRLPLLRQLGLSSVNLSSVDAWPHVVNTIPSLRVIDLTFCFLTSAEQSLPHLNLTNLEELDLRDNEFDHQIATCWFWNITNLRHLDLSYNNLYGQVPKALGRMTSLQYLSLSYIGTNTVNKVMANLKNLCRMRILHLEHCLTGGNIAVVMEKLPQCLPNQLQELYLSSNQLTGVLPNSVGHLTSLRVLDLSMNNIAGHVPYEIGMLTNLTTLSLSGNDMDGVITGQHFAGTKSLQDILLFGNSLKLELSPEWLPPFTSLRKADFSGCQMGPLFPAWLQWQVNISYLDISSTGINDTIPHWFSNAFSNAVYVDLSNNTLSGGLPTNMETMMSLQYLDLSSNRLTGSLPPLPMSLQNLYLGSNQITGPVPPLPPSLYLLDISMNSLVGPLPSDFGTPMLIGLFLFSNRLTGHIPKSICKFENLEYISLGNNNLEGEIPPCLGTTNTVSLGLGNNNLSGELPSSLQNCTNMISLDLSRNNFSGRLPMWIGNLQALQFIRLSHNMFSGIIPISITSLRCLLYLDIADNGMSGSLPMNMLNITSMTQKFDVGSCPSLPSYGLPEEWQSHQDIGLTAVTKGQELDYVSVDKIILMKMVSIDLSSNYLTGEIPRDIAALDALVSLNLSRNKFTGNIPKHIGAMQSLESLDLSRNKLCGDIPSSLSNLTFLSDLDLSYNNLTGIIPSGSQLETIYASHPFMYEGNDGLCGPPLEKSCSTNNTLRQGPLRRTEEDHVPKFFYLGAGSGFVVGTWVVFCALLFKKAWRIAYFRLFDELYDKAYVFVAVTWARLTAN